MVVRADTPLRGVGVGFLVVFEGLACVVLGCAEVRAGFHHPAVTVEDGQAANACFHHVSWKRNYDCSSSPFLKHLWSC